MSWRRVSKRELCPICGHPDCCLPAHDGSAAICPRAESDRRNGEAGWLHWLNARGPDGRRLARREQDGWARWGAEAPLAKAAK